MCNCYYRPQTKFAKVMFLHLSVSHSVHRGLPQCMLGYPPRTRHPPGPGTPQSRHPLGTDIPQSRHPPGPDTPRPGTPQSRCPPEQTPPHRTRHSPDQVPPEQTPPIADTPPGADTPRSSACWEIRSTSGRYASYWNAILLQLIVLVKITYLLLLSSPE